MEGVQTLDTARIRQDFPILARKLGEQPLVYLDSAASAQKPVQVLDAMRDFYTGHYANANRSAHTLAAEASDALAQVRRKVAAFLHASDPDEVIFTPNTTGAINLVAYSWGRANLKAGDEILVTGLEHHANLIPWQLIAAQTGAVLKCAKLGEDQRLDLQSFAEELSARTKLVALGHMSNVLGVIIPVADLAKLAHDAGALVLVDGAQAAPHLPVDVKALGADFYAFSGHKLGGPTGAGALWGRAEVLDAMPPFLGGGGMIDKVEVTHSSYAPVPARFEAGTPNVAAAVGLGAALDYLSALGMDAIFAHSQALLRYTVAQLKALQGVTLYGPEPRVDAQPAERGGIIAFNIEGVQPHDAATALDIDGVAVRAGHHCAEPLMRALGVNATLRASFYLYNTFAEADALVASVAKAQALFADFV